MADLECRNCGARSTYADASIMDALSGDPRETTGCPDDPHGTHDWTEL